MKAGTLSVLAILAGILFSGCATIVSGGDQDIPIKTRPTGARVRVLDSHNMDVWSSRTPATVTLAKGTGYFKGARYILEVEKEGYEPRTISIRSSLNAGWYIAGNLLLGGWIGWLIVDPLTGAMWTLEPDMVNLKLDDAVASAGGSPGMYIVLKEDVPEYVFESDRVVRIN